MAREEINFIRPQEIYDVSNKTSKVAYTGYDGKPHELEVAENLEGDVSEIVNDTFVPNEGGNVVFTDSNETEHELITEDGFAGALDSALPSALAKAQVIETTWADLKDARDDGELIAGSLYRITDYNCTTTQENTQSAGHQFDIVLLALSVNKLAEEGWAMMNESNIYDVTFSDGVTKKCYIYQVGDNAFNVVDVDTLLGAGQMTSSSLTINEENKTATFDDAYEDSMIEEGVPYNYFQNSNLSAWKVWYCLDNDTARFAWADDASEESITAGDIVFKRDVQRDFDAFYGWYSQSEDVQVFTKTDSPKVGDFTYDDGGIQDLEITAVAGFGRGVIYRLIDEFNNDVAYDFKNIQFVRPMTDGEYDASTGTDTWVYTFNGWDGDNSVVFDESVTINIENSYYAFNIKITTVFIDGENNVLYTLPNNVFLVGAYDSSCENSQSCTIQVGAIKLFNCDSIVVNTGDMFINCSSETFDLDDPAIYIYNKKVLTET